MWISCYILIFLSAVLFSSAQLTPGQVETQFGVIQGVIEGDCIIFKGIPFAQPAKRWTAPSAFTGMLNNSGPIFYATSFPPACPQLSAGSGFPAPAYQSEDCLFLNIYMPSRTPNSSSGFPVMVFIYGGGFTIGSASSSLYDAASLAVLHNVIVVEMNYRLGPFGMHQCILLSNFQVSLHYQTWHLQPTAQQVTTVFLISKWRFDGSREI